MAFVARTDRLRLRKVTDSDEDCALYVQMLNQPDWLRYVGDRGVHNLEEARAYIRAGALRSFADNGIGPYAIVVDDSGSREDGGAGVGVAGLFQRPYLDAPDLGYALVTEAQGKGYALEAARAVVAHAKEVLGLSRLLAIVDPEHVRSAGLLTKLGFTMSGTVVPPGETEPINTWELVL